MSKIIKVMIEHDDGLIRFVKGKEAEKWEKHVDIISVLAHMHRMNPFEIDPIKWETIKK